MGGAQANGSYNPLEWNYSRLSSWLGIVGGAVVGGVSAGVGSAVGGAIAGGTPPTTAPPTIPNQELSLL